MKMPLLVLVAALASVGLAQSREVGDWSFTSRWDAEGRSVSTILTVSHAAPGTVPPLAGLGIRCQPGAPTGTQLVILDETMTDVSLNSREIFFWVDGELLDLGTAFPLPPGQSGVMVFPDVYPALFDALRDARTLFTQVVISGQRAPQHLWSVEGFEQALAALGCYEPR